MDTELAKRQKAKGIHQYGLQYVVGCLKVRYWGHFTLCFIYIDDLEDGVASNIIQFADDTNIFRRVQTRQECHTL